MSIWKMLWVTETFGPLAPVEQPRQDMTSPIPHSNPCVGPCVSWGKGRSGTFNNHPKNTKITGPNFRMKTHSQRNTVSETYHFPP